MAIGGAKNAGHLAARILALGDPDLAARIDVLRREMDEAVAAKNDRLDELGLDRYLEEA